MGGHARRVLVRLVAGAMTAIAAGAAAGPPEDDTGYRAGIGLLNKGVPDLAVMEFEKYLKEHADGASAPNARYALAVCLVRLGRHAEASKELDRVLAIKAFEFGADAALLRAQCATAAGDEASAAEVLERLLKDHPDFARADHATALRGEALYRAGDLKAARTVLASVAEKWPRSDEVERAELFCAMAEAGAGDARAGAERAARLRARAPQGAYAANAALIEARCRQGLGEWKECAALYDAAMSSEDVSVKAEATLGRAQAARALGDAAGAAKRLAGLAEMKPSAAVLDAARLERGRVLYDLGKSEEALAVLNELERNEPAALADQAAYWGARCELKLGRAAAAAEHLKAAAARFGQSELMPEMVFDRGVALSRAGNDEAALVVWEEWGKRFPRHALFPEALAARAGCLHRLGKFEESLAVCAELSRLKPNGSRGSAVALLVAENQYLLERYAEAEAAYALFLEKFESDPTSWRASVRRGLCLAKLERAEEAARLLSGTLKTSARESQDPALRRAALSVLGEQAFAKGDWAVAESWYAALAAEDGDGRADALLRQGLSIARQGRGAEAVTIFGRVESDAAGTDLARRAMFERGQILLEMGRLDEARAVLEAVVRAAPYAADVLAPHALVHLAAIASKQGRSDDAAEILARVPEGAGSGDVRMQQASAWLSAGKYAEAERAYEGVMKSAATGEATEARARRAIAINRQGRHDEAIKELDALGAAITPLDAETGAAVKYERALALRSLGRDDDAAAAYRDVLESEPAPMLLAYSALDLAQIESQGERPEKALELLDRCAQQAGKLNASDAARVGEREMYLRGVCLLKLGKAGEAASALGTFREKYPSSELAASAGLALGDALLRAGRATEAAEQFKAVVDSGGPDEVVSVALLKLGDARVAAQRWGQADEAYTAFLDRYKDSELWFQARFGQGWCREQQGRFDGAVEAYRDVASRHTGPTAARAQFQIGECLYAQKRHQEAVAELLKVDVLFAVPEWSAAAVYEAGRCLMEMNRGAEASRQFEDVVARFPDSKWAVMAKERMAATKPAALPGRGGGSAGAK